MGIPAEAGNVILVAGLLARREEAMEGFIGESEKIWGPVSHRSEIFDFDFTDYYEREMGPRLRRQFIAFAPTVRPDALRELKIMSNELEARLSIGGGRRANIDPGYLDLSKLVVASTKDATYRVYLGGGIYAQPMLWYEKGSYHPWPWAYPDYRTSLAISFFNKVRMDYRAKA